MMSKPLRSGRRPARPTRVFALALLACLTIAGCDDQQSRLEHYLASAGVLFDDGNYVKAQVEYQNALQIDPTNVAAMYGLARIEEAQGSMERAFLRYRQLVSQDPTHLGAHEKLATFYLVVRQWNEALESAERVLANDPTNVSSLLVKGTVLANRGVSDAAMQSARAALDRDPASVGAVTLVAKLLEDAGHGDEAVQVLTEGIERQPDNTALLTFLMQLHVRMGQREKVVPLLERLAELQPDNIGAPVTIARYYDSVGDLDRAEAALRHGLETSEDKDHELKIAWVAFLETRRAPSDAEHALRHFIDEQPDALKLRLELAELLQRQGRQDEAMATLESATTVLGESPDVGQAELALAQLMLAEQRTNEAERIVSRVIERDPTNQDALLLRASMALARNDESTAIIDARTVLRDAPQSVAAWKLLAQGHALAGDVPLAREALERARDLDPSDVPSAIMLATYRAQVGDQDAAEQLLSQVLAADEKQIDALIALAELRLKDENWPGALALAERAKTTDPDDFRGYYVSGLALIGASQVNEGIAELRRAVELAPDAPGPLLAVYRTALQNKEADTALAVIDRAIELRPGNFFAIALRGETLFFKGRLDDAEHAFLEAIGIAPEFWSAHHNLASVYFAQGNTDQGLSTLRNAAQESGDNTIRFRLAEAYESLGRRDDAIAEYSKILEQHPKALGSANNLAVLLVKGSPTQAELDRARELTRAFEQTGNPLLMDTVGWVHMKRGEIDLAIPALEFAARNAPGVAEIHYHLGVAYAESGLRDDALRHLRRAIDLGQEFPGLEDAKSRIDKL